MKQKLTEEVLVSYSANVIKNAGHHGQKVYQVIFHLLSCVISKMKEGKDIAIYTRNGVICNALWLTINSTMYYFSYDHILEVVTLKKGGKKGVLTHSFDNSSSLQDILKVFSTL